MSIKRQKGKTEKLTLFVESWSSHCGNCGNNCSPREKKHITNLGYSEEIRKQKGCGVEWKYISGFFNFEEGLAKRIDREDLIEISPIELYEKDKKE